MTTRNRIGHGNKNRICLQLDQAYTQITGGAGGVGADVDVDAKHVFSPCKVLTELIRVYGIVSAGGTSVIRVFAGSSASGTEVASGTISDSITDVLMTLVNPGKVWPADQEFCVSHATTNTETLDYLDVTLCFREYEA